MNTQNSKKERPSADCYHCGRPTFGTEDGGALENGHWVCFRHRGMTIHPTGKAIFADGRWWKSLHELEQNRKGKLEAPLSPHVTRAKRKRKAGAK